MSLPVHLATAYRRSVYSVAGISLRIGRRSPALDQLLVGLGERQAGLVTAWNPRSARSPGRRNAWMMARLQDRLGRIVSLPATGSWANWSEAHLLVGGDIRRLSVLARLFRQNAIVALRRGTPPRLIVLV